MIYKLNGINVSVYGAIPVLSGEKIAANGIFDCPKRKPPTERSWDTEIEPYTDAEDIALDGRELSVAFAMLRTADLEQFKTMLIQCIVLTVDNKHYEVVCRESIEVTVVGSYYRIAARFWQETITLPTLTYLPSATGSIRLDNYNLHDDFGIHSGVVGGFRSIGQRIEVQTTEQYTASIYRDYRELQINCFMVGTSFADLYSKMTQFQALLYKPGFRSLQVDGLGYNCYCKQGFKAVAVADNVLKFTLKLHTND